MLIPVIKKTRNINYLVTFPLNYFKMYSIIRSIVFPARTIKRYYSFRMMVICWVGQNVHLAFFHQIKGTLFNFYQKLN